MYSRLCACWELKLIRCGIFVLQAKRDNLAGYRRVQTRKLLDLMTLSESALENHSKNLLQCMPDSSTCELTDCHWTDRLQAELTEELIVYG